MHNVQVEDPERGPDGTWAPGGTWATTGVATGSSGPDGEPTRVRPPIERGFRGYDDPPAPGSRRRVWLAVAVAAGIVLAIVVGVAGRDRLRTSASETVSPTSSTTDDASASTIPPPTASEGAGGEGRAALAVDLGAGVVSGTTAAPGAGNEPAAATESTGGTEQPAGSATSTATSQASQGTSTEATASTTSTASTARPPAAVASSGDTPIAIVGMTSLANVRIRTNRAAYRFTADRTGSIESLRLYYIVNTSGSGYAGGNGGTMAVTIAPDNGSGLPDESRTLPGTFRSTFNLSGGAINGDRSSYVRNTLLGNWTFDRPVPVERGTTYHLIFDNIDQNPNANYVSLDLVMDLLPDSMTGGPPIPSPARRSDFGFVEDHGSGWYKADTHKLGHWRTPIFQVTYTDGSTQGQGIMQWKRSDTFTLSGSAAIRTTIKVDESRSVSELAARVGHHPSAPVVLELTTIDGSVLRSVTAAANGTANYRNAVWAKGAIEPLTLEAGKEYALVVRAGSGYSGPVVPLLSGRNYGFAAGSVFPFGRAQISSDGRSWSDWGNGLFYQSIAVN